MTDLLIIGGGPAGLTAALYALRSGKTAVLVEKASFGGQIASSPKVENYPGVPAAPGAEIADKMLSQVLDLGGEIEVGEVVRAERIDGGFAAYTQEGDRFEGAALILAPGVKHRHLGLINEDALAGNGVCYCAVCDGAFYKGSRVAVSGGGNSALQDALLLSEKCSRVYLIHRRSEFRGEAKLVEALREKENVEFLTEAAIVALLGEGELEGVVVERRGERMTLDVSGLFVAIGHAPDNAAFASLIDLDPAGYAASDESCLTKTPGVFVAGDCRRKTVRQLTTAVADGSAAALAACEWLG